MTSSASPSQTPPTLPPGLWTLPAGLRRSHGSPAHPGVTLNGLLQTLEIQSSLAPFSCLPRHSGTPWKGVARPRILASILFLAMLAAFCAAWIVKDGAREGLWIGAALALLLVGIMLYRHLHALTITLTPHMVSLRWKEHFRSQVFREPLENYMGVARWNGVHVKSLPLFSWPHRWWVVALVHRDDPRRSIPIMLSEHFDAIVSAQVSTASTFGLPVLLESPFGDAWRPRPVSDATQCLGDRLKEGWSARPTKIVLPQSDQFKPGGLMAWAHDIYARWLSPLLLAPVGAWLDGPQGMVLALIPAILIYAVLWRYWQQGDGWASNGRVVEIVHHRPFQHAEHESIPVSEILAVRLQPSSSGQGTLDLETARKTYSLQVGQTSPDAIQASLERLLFSLQVRR